ncbi:MAG: S8 family serine peptidase [Candidatus Magnetomorum sp.]|nr:S8 family serine peptidase [Candidatus Magnetomorum sp.]
MYTPKTTHKYQMIIFFDLIFFFLFILSSACSATDLKRLQMDIQTVLSGQPAQKTLRVIIEMTLDQPQQEDTSKQSMITHNRLAYKALIQASQKIPMRILSIFQYSPCITLEIERSKLTDLAAIPSVKHIYPDTLSVPSLSKSVPFVGAVKSWELGYTGQGQLIAIIDTGVDATHAFLEGKIISEACFSSQSAGYHSQSLCPGGREAEYGTNAAKSCSSTIKGYAHGTHVAGIAAGHNGQFSGVARDAQIMAIQVFSRFYDSPDNNNICTRMGNASPCIMSFASDQIRALEYIYSQRNNWSIAAVNMSLSSGQPYAKACDNDPRKKIIDRLYEAGIAVVAAAGNSGFIEAIGSPACISNVISVGAVNNQDIIQPFSNSSELLDFFAPGYVIQSSIPDQQFSRMNGTSMASPHVAGAWAIMRSKFPLANVSEILQTLKKTGRILTDVRNNVQISRIQINLAVSEIPLLLPEQTISGQVDQQSWQYYRIQNGTNEFQYTVKLSNLSDDADLYLRHNEKPSLSEWDDRPYKGFQNPETILFHAPQAGLWYVGVYGYRSAQFQLELESISIHPMSSGNTHQDVLDQGEWHYYKLIPLLSNQVIQVQLDDITGDMDLYFQHGTLPNETNFQERSNKNGQLPELIQIHHSGNMNAIYIGVFGYQQGGYTIFVGR